MKANPSVTSKQSGAVLIVALVLLAVVTMLGVANMQSTTMEMRMIGVTMERSKAFAAAEGALRMIEADMETTMNLRVDDVYTDTCSGAGCFTSACPAGLCFDGEFASGDDEIDCVVAPNASSSARVHFWEDSTLWASGSGKYDTVEVGEYKGADKSIKFIIEFLCYVDMGGNFGADPSIGQDRNGGEPLFRTTVYVETGRAPVMLQSTYVVTNFIN